MKINRFTKKTIIERITIVCIITIFSLSFISCEKIISADIPDHGRKVVLNGTVSNDSTIQINLTQSLHILSNQYQFSVFDNAEVKLYENSVFVENMTSVLSGNYRSTAKAKAGNEYKLVVKVPQKDQIETVSKVPFVIKIISIDTLITIVNKQDGGIFSGNTSRTALKFNIKFQDPLGENFYRIEIARRGYYTDPTDPNLTKKPVFFSLEYIDSDDPTINDGNLLNINSGNSIIFSDEYFDGKLHTFPVFINNNIHNNPNNTKFYVNLYSITKDYYKYAKAYIQYQKSEGNFFSEPVQLYNNINNGFGIFVGYSLAVDSI